MVSQEEKAIQRIKAVKKYITECEEIEAQNVYDWAYLSFGIRERTVAAYLQSLKGMGLILIDGQNIKDVKFGGS